MTERASSPTSHGLAALSFAALGVVFGDISTSPLYAVRECFHGEYGIGVTPSNILGVLSLMFWALILIVSFKYLTFILRADNDGEGGVIALTSLIRRDERLRNSAHRGALIAIGLFAASLLYGDGMITPAISVMSALEGLDVLTPAFQPWIIPGTIAILVGLFLIQHRGTARVGALFGPVVLIWLITLGVLGARQLVRYPGILAAVNPAHAVSFLLHNHLKGFLVLGAVFLVVTGTEALYADMGHFGRTPIRLVWTAAVLPALLLNYFGQGALLLAHPDTAHNPFYSMVPSQFLIPVLILATCATIIASQAVITGAFSLTKQAIQMGFLPRLAIRHTSARHKGQIYVPAVNWVLMLATVALVLGFRSSSKLAAAYGVAVTSTMLVTTVLFSVIAHKRWGWSLARVIPLVSLFIVVDLLFFGANISKIMHGAWFPLVIGALVFLLLTTWKQGRSLLAERVRSDAMSLDEFRDRFREVTRVRGTALFLAGTPGIAPSALVHNTEHNQVLHQQVVLLHFRTESVPRVPNSEKVDLDRIGGGFVTAEIRHGFMESPSFDTILDLLRGQGLELEPDDLSVFLGRQKLVVTDRPGMHRWRKHLFVRMAENAQNAAAFFDIPMERVIEVGVPLEL